MSNSSLPAARVDTAHDHQLCVDRCLAMADAVCGEQGARLTPQRRRVLEAVAARHAATGAYDIIETLARDGRRPAPISVYRALDFLLGLGLVHRLASLNAYIACVDPGASHRAQFLICNGCRTIVELHNNPVDGAIAAGATAVGFDVSSTIVEVAGLCRSCRQT